MVEGQLKKLEKIKMGNKKSRNKERMHSYAKGGGLMGYTKGGSVLDEKQLGGIVKAVKPFIKKAANKIKKIYTDYKGTTYDPELLENTGYARKVDLERGIKNRKQSTGSN